MAEELPVSLVGNERDRYLRRLETRMEFLHDFISGHEDGWGLEGEDLEEVVEHLARAWTVAAKSEIKLVVDRGHRNAERRPQNDNVIPFRPRLIP
ncbi:MAG TPA: hypothetical protein VJQ51_10900 [Burkholderiales bacterium]|nr:hypothetical protein [Burkholderiales bacterium]